MDAKTRICITHMGVDSKRGKAQLLANFIFGQALVDESHHAFLSRTKLMIELRTTYDMIISALSAKRAVDMLECAVEIRSDIGDVVES